MHLLLTSNAQSYRQNVFVKFNQSLISKRRRVVVVVAIITDKDLEMRFMNEEMQFSLILSALYHSPNFTYHGCVSETDLPPLPGDPIPYHHNNNTRVRRILGLYLVECVRISRESVVPSARRLCFFELEMVLCPFWKPSIGS